MAMTNQGFLCYKQLHLHCIFQTNIEKKRIPYQYTLQKDTNYIRKNSNYFTNGLFKGEILKETLDDRAEAKSP